MVIDGCSWTVGLNLEKNRKKCMFIVKLLDRAFANFNKRKERWGKLGEQSGCSTTKISIQPLFKLLVNVLSMS